MPIMENKLMKRYLSQTFYSSGIFYSPKNVDVVYVTLIGGGGGGGGGVRGLF